MNNEKLIKTLFSKPKIILLIANVNEGKSMVLYHLYNLLKKTMDFDLVSYGLKVDLGEKKIYSVEQLENQQNKLIFGDEILNLFDLEDRKSKKQIEKTLRLVNHKNNVLILAGLPENMKKFLSAKADMIIFKKCSFDDFINGSKTKRVCLNYKGSESGSSVLNLDKDMAILWDGEDYHKLDIPYYKEFDTKFENVPIIVPKNIHKNVDKGENDGGNDGFVKNPLNIDAKTINEELKEPKHL